MLKAEPLPPDASIASTGLAARYIDNKVVYGYSGAVAATNSITPITMIKFTSGSKILKVFFQYFDNNDQAIRRFHELSLNGEVVIQNSYDGTPDNGGHGIYYNAIIPPHTEVEFGSNIVATTDNMFATMTGAID